MLTYIYFVKCPGCEDEHFDFFTDAKDFALGCLSKKPIITQIEVDRNDFGECTDSCDLGTVWSWEDLMDTKDDSPDKHTVFTKDDLKNLAVDDDPEFTELDNSLEPDIRKPVPSDMTVEDLVEAMEENEDDVECKFCNELFDKSECKHDKDYGWLCSGCQRAIEDHGGELAFTSEALTEASKYRDSIELHYDSLTTEITTKVIPATRWDPEEYEEGEYTDEYDFEVDTESVIDAIWEHCLTEEDVLDVPGGLAALEDEATWEQFLEANFESLLEKYNDKLLELFREEAEEAAKEEFQDRYADRHSGEPDPDRAYDEWRDSQYLDDFDESCPRRFVEEALDPRDQVELEYPSLTVTLYGPKRAADDWDEIEHTDSFVFLVPKVEVAVAIGENWLTEEDVKDVPGGLDALDDDKVWEQFIDAHFDDLFEKYNKQILEYFEDEATEDFRERSQEEYSMGEWAASQDYSDYDEQLDTKQTQKPFLEEFDDAETHKANLIDCPECGSVSYDMKEQYCANCGLNL